VSLFQDVTLPRQSKEDKSNIKKIKGRQIKHQQHHVMTNVRFNGLGLELLCLMPLPTIF